MIRSIHDDETNKVWKGEFSKKIPVQIQSVARRKLRMINNAKCIDVLRIPPNNRLEFLKGNGASASMTSGGYVLSGTMVMRNV
ncbi:MAG: type II toxin-antitoxin system RelE/ParE family toxin [Methylobacter sp.]